MFKRNVGRLDRIVRFILGGAMLLIGLFVLRGWQGNWTGIGLALFALVPLATSLAGICPAYTLLGISTASPPTTPDATFRR